MVAGLQGFTSGHLRVGGEPPQAGRRETAYALARDALLPWRDALGNVELALQIRGVAPQERRRRCARMRLARVGLADASTRHPAQLSQGMRQRVALARTFVTEPRLLILDEPFAALDAQTRIRMQDLLLALLRQFSGTMIMVTHDIAEAIILADRVVVFSQRPATVTAIYDVKLGNRQRKTSELRTDPEFSRLFESIWQDIEKEFVAWSDARDTARRRRARTSRRSGSSASLLIAVFVVAWKLTGATGLFNPIFIGTPEGTLRAVLPAVRQLSRARYRPRLHGRPRRCSDSPSARSAECSPPSCCSAQPAARRAVAPLVVAANSLPRVALAPLFVLWFGLGIAGKVALVVSLVFFVMLTTTLAGLTQPNRDHEYLARSLGASRRQHILYFVVPAAVPTIVAGLELSLTYSFLGAVAGEIVGGSYGIGVRLTIYANSFEIDKFLALLLLLVIVSTTTVQVMRHFSAKLTRWHAAEQGEAY